MRRLARVLTLGLVAVMLSAPGATPVAVAATVEVKMRNGSFSPSVANPGLGGTIRWINNSGQQHTAMSRQGFFYPQLEGDGNAANVPFQHAGTFGYYCPQHPSTVGYIKVPLKAPASASSGFTLRWSVAGSLIAGRTFDVQKRAPGSSTWTTLGTNTSARSVVLNPTRNGTWSYRARTDNVSAGLSSGWSPVKLVKVS